MLFSLVAEGENINVNIASSEKQKQKKNISPLHFKLLFFNLYI